MKLIRNVLIGIFLIIVLLLAVAGYTYNNWTTAPLPEHAGTVTLQGIDDTIEIIRDDYGVPHIYASTVHDLRFAQGYVQAQDRWWQMEMSRHIGYGRIQELTGKNQSAMGSDIFIRHVGWRQMAENDLANMDAESRAELQSFADGVNAYIMNRDKSELAFEYTVLGLTGVEIDIDAWQPLDSLVWTKVMAWDLSGNRSAELRNATLLAEFGEAMFNDLVQPYPYGEKPTIILPEDLPESGEPFGEPLTIADDTAGILGATSQLAGGFDDTQGFLFGKGEGIGSNNWVVSGDLTASGMPLLADDPHLGIQMPSIWYEVGLYCQPITDDCPYHVRGFAFPASPTIVIGHNQHIAWGVTNVGWDTQDVYRIKVNPENPLQYELDGEWVDMTVRNETISFGDDEPDLTIQVRETIWGAILNDNQRINGELQGFNNDDPYAMRWTASDVGTIFQSLVHLNKATNFEEFREALAYWDIPSQNIVYADVEGNIGYQTPGRIPVRAPGHTGQLPVDGSTTDNMWRGYVPYEYLPSVYNPERGYIASANQALVPMEYYDYLRDALADEFGEDAHYVFDYGWAAGYRGQRIVEMLEATDEHTLDTFRAIHGDNKMIVAEEIAPYIADVDMGTPTLNEARDWMLDWDYQMHMDSPQAALFATFWTELMHNLYEDQLGNLGTPSGNASDMLATSNLMQSPDNIWWDNINTPDVIESRNDIIAESFRRAHQWTIELLGEDRTQWQWGTLHTATFASNPLGQSGVTLIENMVNVRDVPVSGGGAIVNATGWSTANRDFTVRALPSMRMVIDLGDFSNNRSIHTTGQSGHPFSDQYHDMVEDWRNINYNPMLSTRDDVQANADATLILQPE